MDRTTSPNYQHPLHPIQKTLALIRPEAMGCREAIIRRILDAGFKILDTTIVKLTPEQASELYGNLDDDESDFPLKVASLCKGPIQAMCLAKPEAIAEFRALLGADTAAESRHRWPGSLRAMFAERGVFNGILGSRDVARARIELRFFFPNVLLEPAITERPDQWRYLNAFVYPTLMDGIYEMAKEQPADAVVVLAEWLWRNNPNKPLMCPMEVHLMRDIDALKAEYVRPCEYVGSVEAVYVRQPAGGRAAEATATGAAGAAVPVQLDGVPVSGDTDGVQFVLPVINEDNEELNVDRCQVRPSSSGVVE